MARHRQSRRGNGYMRGRGFGADLIKKILMDGAPLVGKLLEGPASELSKYLGSRVKKLTGGNVGDQLANDFAQLRLEGPQRTSGRGYNLAGQGTKLAGEGLRLAGEKKRQSMRTMY